MLQPQSPGLGQVVGQVVAEDLQRPLHPGAGRHRGPGRPAQVGVVEVGQPVGGRPHLPAHPPLLPGQHALVRAEPGQQRADRVAVPHHHPVDPAHLARLGLDAHPAGRADQRQRRLRPGTGDLQRRRPARLGERAVGQERAPPGRLRVADPARDHLRRQPPYGPAALVEQAGLPGQPLAVLDHPDDVAVALAQPRAGEHLHLAGVPVHLGDVPAKPARGRAGVQLRLDHHPATDDVQPPGEPQQRGDLRPPVAGLGHRQATELVLHRRRHRHWRIPASRPPSDTRPAACSTTAGNSSSTVP